MKSREVTLKQLLWIFSSPWLSEGVKGIVRQSDGKFTSSKLSLLLPIALAVLNF